MERRNHRFTRRDLGRLLSLLLAFVLCLSLVPGQPLAAGGDTAMGDASADEGISVFISDLGDLPAWIGRDCESLSFTILANCGSSLLAGNLGVRLWDAEAADEWSSELTLKRLVSTSADVSSRVEEDPYDSSSGGAAEAESDAPADYVLTGTLPLSGLRGGETLYVEVYIKDRDHYADAVLPLTVDAYRQTDCSFFTDNNCSCIYVVDGMGVVSFPGCVTDAIMLNSVGRSGLPELEGRHWVDIPTAYEGKVFRFAGREQSFSFTSSVITSAEQLGLEGAALAEGSAQVSEADSHGLRTVSGRMTLNADGGDVTFLCSGEKMTTMQFIPMPETDGTYLTSLKTLSREGEFLTVVFSGIHLPEEASAYSLCGDNIRYDEEKEEYISETLVYFEGSSLSIAGGVYTLTLRLTVTGIQGGQDLMHHGIPFYINGEYAMLLDEYCFQSDPPQWDYGQMANISIPHIEDLLLPDLYADPSWLTAGSSTTIYFSPNSYTGGQVRWSVDGQSSWTEWIDIPESAELTPPAVPGTLMVSFQFRTEGKEDFILDTDLTVRSGEQAPPPREVWLTETNAAGDPGKRVTESETGALNPYIGQYYRLNMAYAPGYTCEAVAMMDGSQRSFLPLTLTEGVYVSEPVVFVGKYDSSYYPAVKLYGCDSLLFRVAGTTYAVAGEALVKPVDAVLLPKLQWSGMPWFRKTFEVITGEDGEKLTVYSLDDPEAALRFSGTPGMTAVVTLAYYDRNGVERTQVYGRESVTESISIPGTYEGTIVVPEDAGRLKSISYALSNGSELSEPEEYPLEDYYVPSLLRVTADRRYDGAQIVLFPALGGRYLYQSLADGEALFPRLPVGDYRYTVSGDRGVFYGADITVDGYRNGNVLDLTAMETADVTVRLEKPEEMSDDAFAREEAGLLIRYTLSLQLGENSYSSRGCLRSGATLKQVPKGAELSFSLESSYSGSSLRKLKNADEETGVYRVSLTNGGEQTITLELECFPTVTLTGQVVSQSGKPIRGASVSVAQTADYRPTEGGWRIRSLYPYAVTDADGNYEFTVSAGFDLDLTVQAEACAAVEQHIPAEELGIPLRTRMTYQNTNIIRPELYVYGRRYNEETEQIEIGYARGSAAELVLEKLELYNGEAWVEQGFVVDYDGRSDPRYLLTDEEGKAAVDPVGANRTLRATFSDTNAGSSYQLEDLQHTVLLSSASCGTLTVYATAPGEAGAVLTDPGKSDARAYLYVQDSYTRDSIGFVSAPGVYDEEKDETTWSLRLGGLTGGYSYAKAWLFLYEGSNSEGVAQLAQEDRLSDLIYNGIILPSQYRSLSFSYGQGRYYEWERSPDDAPLVPMTEASLGGYYGRFAAQDSPEHNGDMCVSLSLTPMREGLRIRELIVSRGSLPKNGDSSVRLGGESYSGGNSVYIYPDLLPESALLSFYAGDKEGTVRASVHVEYEDAQGEVFEESFGFRGTAAKLELTMADQAIIGQNADNFLVRVASLPGKTLTIYDNGTPVQTLTTGSDGTASARLVLRARKSGENHELYAVSDDLESVRSHVSVLDSSKSMFTSDFEWRHTNDQGPQLWRFDHLSEMSGVTFRYYPSKASTISLRIHNAYGYDVNLPDSEDQRDRLILVELVTGYYGSETAWSMELVKNDFAEGYSEWRLSDAYLSYFDSFKLRYETWGNTPEAYHTLYGGEPLSLDESIETIRNAASGRELLENLGYDEAGAPALFREGTLDPEASGIDEEQETVSALITSGDPEANTDVSLRTDTRLLHLEDTPEDLEDYIAIETEDGVFYQKTVKEEVLDESTGKTTIHYRQTFLMPHELYSRLADEAELQSVESTVMDGIECEGYITGELGIIQDMTGSPIMSDAASRGFGVVNAGAAAYGMVKGPQGATNAQPLWQALNGVKDMSAYNTLAHEIADYEEVCANNYITESTCNSVNTVAGTASSVAVPVKAVVLVGTAASNTINRLSSKQADQMFASIMRSIQAQIELERCREEYQDRERQRREEEERARRRRQYEEEQKRWKQWADRITKMSPEELLREKGLLGEDEFPKFRMYFDPSGFVFEGTEDNRVSGVTATIYQNMGSAECPNYVKWDDDNQNPAERQTNPLRTAEPDEADPDAAGRYGWDVPAGEWQVRFHDEAGRYLDAETNPMTVPPMHDTVNIGLLPTAAPGVTLRWESGELILRFDRYMQLESLVDVTSEAALLQGSAEGGDGTYDARYSALSVMDRAGNIAEGRLRFGGQVQNTAYKEGSYQMDSVASDCFVKELIFTPEEGLPAGDYSVMLSGALSFAGVPLEDTDCGAFRIEGPKQEDALLRGSWTAAGDALNVSVTVTKLTGSELNGRVYAAAYQDGRMLAVGISERRTLTGMGNSAFTLSIPGAAAAQEVRLFLLNDEAMPLCAAAEAAHP